MADIEIPKDFITAVTALSGALWVLSFPAVQFGAEQVRERSASESDYDNLLAYTFTASTAAFANMIVSVFELAPAREQTLIVRFFVVVLLALSLLPMWTVGAIRNMRSKPTFLVCFICVAVAAVGVLGRVALRHTDYTEIVLCEVFVLGFTALFFVAAMIETIPRRR